MKTFSGRVNKIHFLKVYYDSILNYVMKLVISLLRVIYLVCMQYFPWDLNLVPPHCQSPYKHTCISQPNSMLPSKQHISISCYTQTPTFPNLNSTETLSHYLPPSTRLGMCIVSEPKSVAWDQVTKTLVFNTLEVVRQN